MSRFVEGDIRPPPRMEEVSHNKPHPGLSCQVPGGIAPGCTTNIHKTHKTERQKVRYLWHPLYAHKMIIRHRRVRRGCPTAACVPEDDPKRASLEIPEWMFDRTQCSQMRFIARAQVCWMALADLSSLLEQATCRIALVYGKRSASFLCSSRRC